MKLTIVFLIACCLQLSARTYSQTVNIDVKATSLAKVFSAIEKQTGYVFFYDGSILREAKPVTLTLASTELEPALRQLFAGQPLTYSIKEKTINVFRKTAQPVVQTETPVFSIPPPPPTVHGRITNEKGEPVVGVSIAIKGGKVVGVSDNNGEFTLTNVPDAAVLVFSAVTIETYEVKLNGRKELAFTAKTKTSVLDEVQIIAYGNNTRRYSTDNVAIIKSTDIEKQPVNNPLMALEGRVPGLFITQNNGLSGSGVSVMLQGQNSLSKSNDPFYVIDGVPYVSQLLPNLGGALGTSGANLAQNGSPMSFINPSDIESISILKDADATAIYGSRAANGAILITTKKGVAGQTRFDVTVRNGWGKVTRFLDLMNTQQFVMMRKEAFRNDNITPTISNAADLLIYDTTRYTDWQKTLIGGTAQYFNADISASGGNKNTQYMVGGTYHRETTVFPTDLADQKGSVHANINSLSDNKKFKLQLSMMYLYDYNRIPNVDITQRSEIIAPNSPSLYNPDGTLNWAPDPTGNSTFINPLASFQNTYNDKTSNLITNLVASYTLAPGLELRSNFGYTNLQSNETVLIPLTSTQPELRATTNRRAQYGNNNINSWIIEPQLNYAAKITNRLKMEALLGTTLQRVNSNGSQLAGTGYNSDASLEDIKSASSVSVNSSINSVYRYNALFTRLSGNLDGKYLLNVSARRDGTSRFGANNRFHNFGSIGAGWIFSQESFVKNRLSFLSYGKLRVSYGTTGNDQIGDYQYLDLYSPVSGITTAYQGIVSTAPNRLANPYLQWEETRKMDIGLDLGCFNDRLVIGANFFSNRSSNQLASYSLPISTGFSIITENLPATIQNTGWEFSAHGDLIKSKGFNWSIDLNMTIPSNKLVSYEGIEKTSDASRYIVGQPITIRKAYHFVGIDPASGLFLFADRLGNPTLTPNSLADMTQVINLAPTLYGGLSNSISYKGLHLDFLFQFVRRNGVNYNFGANNPGFSKYNQPVSVLDRWQKPGDIASNPRYNSNSSIFTNFNRIATQSDAGIADASFVRLKNLSLSWDLPDAWKTKLKMRTARLFVQGQNLLTITGYSGMDPENLSTTSLPPLRVITVGAQVGL